MYDDDQPFDEFFKRLEKILQDLENRLTSAAIGYETNDQLVLENGLLWVNGSGITLEKREAILVTLLVEHALNIKDGSKSQFLPKKILLDRIEDQNGKEWRYPISSDVDRVVHTLRVKFQKNDISRRLIETRALSGLRLSTPPWNIRRLDPV